MNYTVPADDVEIQSRWEEIGTVPFKVQKFIWTFCIANYVTEFGNTFASDANFGRVPVICCIMEGILGLY